MDVVGSRLRAATTKTRKALWVELHPALADAIEAAIGPREDRNPEARLFGTREPMRCAPIAKGCKAAGIPPCRRTICAHRRISLMRSRGIPWARTGESVGQRILSVTADTYMHVLTDETELDYPNLLQIAHA